MCFDNIKWDSQAGCGSRQPHFNNVGDVCVHVTVSGVLLIYCFIFHAGRELQCCVVINHKPPIELHNIRICILLMQVMQVPGSEFGLDWT